MEKTLWLLACFGIFYACSCRKTPVGPAFQNTFSCKINGVDWKPEGGTEVYPIDWTEGRQITN